MTTIPGTDYRISGNQILAPDGQAISKEQFVAKVKSNEISLTENSLRFLDSQLGPDLRASLPGITKQQVEIDDLVSNLTKTSQSPADMLGPLMEALAKLTQEQRKAATTARASAFEAQIGQLHTQVDKMKEAADWRLAAGIASGAMSMASGAVSVGAAGAAYNNPNELQSKAILAEGQGWSETLGSVGKFTETAYGHVASMKEQDAKMAEINAKIFESNVGEMKDLESFMREMEGKVREVLQSIQSAESDAAKSVARM